MSLHQLENLINLIKSAPPLANPDVAAMRAAVEQMGRMLPIDPSAVFAPVRAGAVEAEWCDVPYADKERVILYVHGGGYVSGSIAVYRSMAANLSRAASARVLTIECSASTISAGRVASTRNVTLTALF